jgi:hypothetical protein
LYIGGGGFLSERGGRTQRERKRERKKEREREGGRE